MAGERQSVPARHGIATFVPKGHSIKIINTYGSQTVDTWAFALQNPPNKESEAEDKAEEEAIKQAQQEAERDTHEEQRPPADAAVATEVPRGDQKSPVDKPMTAPKDEPEAAQATAGAEAPSASTAKPTTETVDGKKIRTWASYVPSVRSVSALRYRRQAPAVGQSQDAAKTSDDQTVDESAKEKADEKTAEEKDQRVDDKPQKAQDQTGKGDAPAQAEEEGVKVAGTATPSDKSEDDYADAKSVQSSKSWGSYLPAIRARAKAAYGGDQKSGTDARDGKGNSKSWLSYLPSGASFTSYLPNSGKEALSAFAASHHRDPNKSYAEQLYEFSKTPVGAASLSAATGSGTAGSLYAAYTAYTKLQASQRSTGPMEYLSLPHTIDALQSLSPAPGNTLLSNLHGPLLTLLEDTTPPTTAADADSDDATAIPLRHGTILPACDPTTYRELAEAEEGEEHGSCAENAVLALQEFNKSTGLKGARTVGADVTINSVPVPLSLFMNASVSPGTGKVVVREPRRYEGGRWGKGGEKGGWVKLRAERDVVVVMSACPMDVGPTNGGRCMAANFVVEEPGEDEKGERKAEEKPKVQTTSEKINAQKELKKAAPKKEVKKAAPREAQKVAPKEIKNTAAPEDKEKRRDSGHGVAGAAAKPANPAVEDKIKRTDSGVQTPKTETSTASNEQYWNMPKAGKKKPKKLERRSSSKAPV